MCRKLKFCVQIFNNVIIRLDHLKNSAIFCIIKLTSTLTQLIAQFRQVLEWRLEKLLNEREKNPGCYSELISMCGKIQNVPLAMEVFTSMEANGIKPTSSIFNALILA